MNRELKELVDAALVDGKISVKEKEVLVKKAMTHGIEESEFEIYLSGKIKKSRTPTIVYLGIICFILMFGYLIYNEVIKPCENVGDCLTKYNFEWARKYNSKKDDGVFGMNKKENIRELNKIIEQEANYWAGQGDFVKALRTAKELESGSYTLIMDIMVAQSQDFIRQGKFDEGLDVIDNLDQSIFESKIAKLRFNSLKKIIESLCDKQNFDRAQYYLLKAPNNFDEDGQVVQYNNSQRSILKKLLNDYQKTIK